jgi:hypothetical protein
LERLAEPGRFPSGVFDFFFSPGRRGWAAGVVQGTGLRRALRFVGQSLQQPHFLLELLDPQLLLLDGHLLLFDHRLLLSDHAQQCLNQRSSLLRRNLNAAKGVRIGLPCHAQRKASSPIFVKTDFHGVIEN